MNSMTANELRIGNWVMSTEASEPTQIYALGIVAQSQCEAAQSIPKYEPIPLTEEWLLRFGFIQVDRKTEKHYKKGVFNWYSSSGIVIEFDNGINGYDFYLDDCKYVHQLQNLFYCLTGEELTIK